MSASSKKKLRREQDAAMLTEKQKTEKKEAGKLKFYTIATCVLLVAVLLAFIGIIVSNSGIVQRSTTALQVGDHKVTTVELSYNYINTVNNFTNQYGSAVSLFGLDVTKSLGSQTYSEETGETWADYFLTQAEQTVRSTYALCDAAKAEGYAMSDSDKATVESTITSLETTAKNAGYSDVNACLRALYGKGANLKSYRSYVESQVLASSYYNDHQASLSYTDADRREMEADDYNVYSSFSYNTYYVSRSSFLSGGTTDEDGNTTYTDEEYTEAAKAAETAATSLTGSSITTVEQFNDAIAGLEINKDKENVTSTVYTDTRYASVSSTVRDWVTDANRKAGDTTIIANTSTDADGNEVINGYYAVFFVGSNDNIFPLANVRHILVSFEGGTQDSNGNTTYSDEEKDAAKKKAEDLLNEWKSGDATEESFAELATANTTDTGSKENGGLYENVYPGQMVTNFNDWCFDDARKAGDTGIVESTYGYHVMYYVGDSDLTYRDYLLDNAMTTRDMESWYTGLTEALPMTVKTTRGLTTDLVLSTSSSSSK